MYKKIMTLCFFIQTSVCVPIAFDLTHVFPEDMHGWFWVTNRHHLQQFITKNKPKKIVEIGTWLGVSAIFMAKLLEPGAKLYCIDPWMPYEDMQSMPDCQARMKDAYERFLSNCIHNNVTDRIVPMRMTSLKAVNQFSSDIDLIYIDGSHKEEDVFNDIMNWYSKLALDGIMCGDDMCWEGVQQAVYRCAELLHVTVKSDENFWWFEKKA